MPNILDFSDLNSNQFADLISRKKNGLSEGYSGDFLLNPDYAHWVVSPKAKPSAVLIPIVERENGLQVLLTKRAEALKNHSGQIAFPGGKIDPEDKDVFDTALREAHEEIDLTPNEVNVLGRLADYYSGSGYKIAPVIGLVNASSTLNPNPDEVDHIFEVPLAFLMDEENHRKGSRMFKGNERFFFEMPYKQHFIWGVTAGIIRLFYDRLIAE